VHEISVRHAWTASFMKYLAFQRRVVNYLHGVNILYVGSPFSEKQTVYVNFSYYARSLNTETTYKFSPRLSIH